MEMLYERLVFVFFGFTIYLLISSMFFKNKNSLIVNKYLSIINIIYTFLLIFIVPIIFGLEEKIGYIIFYVGFMVNLIGNVINLVITSYKIKRVQVLKKIIIYNIFKYLVILVPVILILVQFFIELNYINKANVILVTNYQNGIIESDDDYYAVSKNLVNEFYINPSFKGKEVKKYTESHSYNFIIKEDELEVKNNYFDDEYKKIDLNKVKEIIKDSKYKEMYIQFIDDSGYMIIEYVDNNGTIKKSSLYKDYIYIDDYYFSGDIKELLIYE